MTRALLATCLDCRKQQKVRRFLLDRAARPRCRFCSGPLDLSASGKESLGAAHDAQQGEKPCGRRRRQEEPAPRLVPEHEAGRYEFGVWPDLYRWCKRDAETHGRSWPEQFTWQLFYGEAIARPVLAATPSHERWAITLINGAEQALYAGGRPYYKVWPGIAVALCDTEVRIASEYLHLPHPAMEIRLPRSDNPLDPFTALLAMQIDEAEFVRAGLPHDDGRLASLVLVTFDNIAEFQQRDDAGHYHVADIPLRPGLLLEDAIDQTRLLRECPDPDGLRRLMRVVVGLAFFAADQHELILPDLPRRVIDRYQRARRQPTPREAERERTAAREAGLNGFTVGREIDLPRPVVQQHDGGRPAPGTGQGLTAGHVRRGHLHLYRIGKGREQERVRFVHPILVRPDLPLRQRGFRVGRPPA